MRAAVVRALCLSSVVILGLAPAARAQGGATGPAYDCAKAQGEVQQLVCKDAALAALDRKLDGVYKAALAKARDAMPATLRAEQRGWVKGRDECWKSRNGDPTWITASWQVSTVRGCVEASYRVRISELQAVWGLAPAKGPTAFACQRNPANEVVATFFETDPPAARLERGDQTVTAWLVATPGGPKYEGRNVTFVGQGKTATVTWLDETLACESK
ncbi:MAG: lysozyme inhibitor LprI family protein [Vicinamibacteria bacterium]